MKDENNIAVESIVHFKLYYFSPSQIDEKCVWVWQEDLN